MKKSNILSLKGIPDLLPDDLVYWHIQVSLITCSFFSYAYQEIRLPLLESTHLFVHQSIHSIQPLTN